MAPTRLVSLLPNSPGSWALEEATPVLCSQFAGQPAPLSPIQPPRPSTSAWLSQVCPDWLSSVEACADFAPLNTQLCAVVVVAFDSLSLTLVSRLRERALLHSSSVAFVACSIVFIFQIVITFFFKYH